MIDQIRAGLKDLNLTGLPLCIHCSLRSFGEMEGGASTIIEGLLAEGCTALVPTFSYKFSVSPPPDQRPSRNGWDYSCEAAASREGGLLYDPNSQEIDRDMGALAAAIVTLPGRCRGDHALNSFAAVGAIAHRLIAEQRPLDVYGPLKALAAADGFVVLMGVGPQKMTLIHLAEAMAGRRLFRRWANGPDGRSMMYETGGCSDGFDNLDPVLSLHGLTSQVGQSRWRAFPARDTLAALANQIRSRPEVTRCSDSSCERCEDAVRGGPILST